MRHNEEQVDVDWKCKIADFGLSRETHVADGADGSGGDYYRASAAGLFPVCQPHLYASHHQHSYICYFSAI